MKIMDFLNRLFHKRPKELTEEELIIQQHPELKPCPLKGIVQASEVGKRLKILKIQSENQKRRQKFAHSEHFKQRQPTTARKLWKPNAKIEEDN